MYLGYSKKHCIDAYTVGGDEKSVLVQALAARYVAYFSQLGTDASKLDLSEYFKNEYHNLFMTIRKLEKVYPSKDDSLLRPRLRYDMSIVHK